MWLEILIACLTLFLGLYFYMTKVKWTYWSKRGVKTMESRFPLGSLPEFFTKKRHINEILMDQFNKHSKLPYFGIYFLKNPILIVQDVEIIRQICVKDFDYFVDRSSAKLTASLKKSTSKTDRIWMSQMTSADGEHWKHLRSTFSPIFTAGKMKSMLKFMKVSCDQLVQAIDDFKGQDFELKETLGKYSMDTIASCAFGVDAQSFTNDKSKFVEYASTLFTSKFKDVFKILFLFIPGGIKLFSLLNLSFAKATETNFFYNVVLDSLKHRRETKSRRNDLIDLMVDAIKGDIVEANEQESEQFEKDAQLKQTKNKKYEFDEDTIVATAIVFLVAGYDTTGTTLAWTCYELAKNPHVQDKLRSEIQDAMSSDNAVTYDDLNQLTYLDQVISETLRLHTPAALLQRSCIKDYQVPDGSGLIIEKDTAVWISAIAPHFNKEHYETPHQFNPDHFSKEAKAKRSPYAYLPFGQGPRGCIGMRFALIEAKLALVNIVKSFNLTPSTKTSEPIKLEPKGAIAYAQNGLYIKAEKL